MQQRGADLGKVRDDIHSLLAMEQSPEHRSTPVQAQGLLPPAATMPSPAAVGAVVAQCARSEPPINPRTRAAEAQRWLAAVPLAADGKNLCQARVEKLAELVPRTRPDLEKRIAGMVYLYKSGVTVSELPDALPGAAGSSSTVKLLPSVTIVVPTCFHRRRYHRDVYDMMAAQDYPGKLEFLVLDGACTSASQCNSKLSGRPSAPLAQAAESDQRLRYVFVTNETVAASSGVDIERTNQLPRTLGQSSLQQTSRPAPTSFPLVPPSGCCVPLCPDKRRAFCSFLDAGEKRNWLVQHATGDYIAHFDDDDFYASHYISRMVAQILELDVVFIKRESLFAVHVATQP